MLQIKTNHTVQKRTDLVYLLLHQHPPNVNKIIFHWGKNEAVLQYNYKVTSISHIQVYYNSQLRSQLMKLFLPTYL
jgi:hypothetical protein